VKPFKQIISTQKKQPDCKKGATLFKIASVKKVVKSKEAAKKGCDGIG